MCIWLKTEPYLLLYVYSICLFHGNRHENLTKSKVLKCILAIYQIAVRINVYKICMKNLFKKQHKQQSSKPLRFSVDNYINAYCNIFLLYNYIIKNGH